MSTPEKLINIFEKLPESEKNELIDFAEYLQEKKQRQFYKKLEELQVDDEPLTPEEIEGLKRAEEDIKEGRVSTAEDVYKRL